MNSDTVEIWTDGACRGNPGPGGWGAVLRFNGKEKEISGDTPETTNNRMELMAAIRALETLKRPCRVHLTTDSNYVRQGITEWLPRWRANGWKTAARKPVKNADLWHRLEAADLTVKRPGTGIPAAKLSEVIGRVTTKTIEANRLLHADDVSP